MIGPERAQHRGNLKLMPAAEQKEESNRRVPNVVTQKARRHNVTSPQGSADLGLEEPHDQ